MNCKKYSLAIICVYFIPILIIWLSAWFLPEERYMDGEYPYWKQQKDYIMSNGDKSEILLLGDSRVKTGIIPKDMGNNVYNLALGGGTPIEMYYTLKNYLIHHPKPTAVIIAFGPIHYENIICYWNRALYFHYLDDDYILEVDKIMDSDEKSDNTSYEYMYHLPSVYAKPIKNYLLHPKTGDRTEINNSTYKKALDSKGRLFLKYNLRKKTHVSSYEAKQNQDFKLLPCLDHYINMILTLCKEESIPVYIDQLPMGKEGHQILSSNGYFESYKKYMNSLAEKYDIPVEDEIPLFENQYFTDNSHLNDEGAKILTAMWREKYKALLE